MAENSPFLNASLCGVLFLLTAVLLVCLLRAILGPRFTDRIVALNLICTVVILMICILAYLLQLPYLIDVAMVYGLLNLLAVSILSRVSIGHHRRKEKKP